MEGTYKILDLPKNERPMERLFRYGASSISNVELLAIILRSGSAKNNVMALSNRLLNESGGLNGLLNCDVENLTKFNGIGKAKAAQLLALAEIAKRFKSFKSGDNYVIKSPEDAAYLVMDELRTYKKEYLKVILLNTKNLVISIEDVSIGSLNSSIVHPREVFSQAIKKSAASIVICHNHPSGDPTPSNEDINITKRLVESGKLLGIQLVDHLIIGDGVYISLKEKGLL
ncbi:MAG TPA: DNA repair protein RadC [Clostridiaceae bacterium]